MVLGPNSVIDNTMNLLSAGCCWVVGTLRFRSRFTSLWHVPCVVPST